MKRGFSLIELVITMFFVLFFSSIGIFYYTRYIEKQELKKVEVSLVSFLNKYQSFSYSTQKSIVIYFDLEEGIVSVGKDSIHLSDSFSYSSKNAIDKKIFKRNFNTKGNLNRGFTLLVYKKGKLVKEIAYNSINSIYFPITRVKDYV